MAVTMGLPFPHILNAVIARAAADTNVQSLVLSGSAARGMLTEHSDLDVFVIVAAPSAEWTTTRSRQVDLPVLTLAELADIPADPNDGGFATPSPTPPCSTTAPTGSRRCCTRRNISARTGTVVRSGAPPRADRTHPRRRTPRCAARVVLPDRHRRAPVRLRRHRGRMGTRPRPTTT
ncbi:MAG: hypothetical protein DLM58_06800 [Pseudonocardiales bacterium]|nr:MAG: hypothetical protein DLM58_06800 [Pseudonocardiales bacterium]